MSVKKELRGGIAWYNKKDQLHRLDGPAVEYTDGSKVWYVEHKLHRLDGPAAEYASGDKYWFYEDELIECNSQEEFERLIKLKAFW